MAINLLVAKGTLLTVITHMIVQFWMTITLYREMVFPNNVVMAESLIVSMDNMGKR